MNADETEDRRRSCHPLTSPIEGPREGRVEEKLEKFKSPGEILTRDEDVLDTWFSVLGAVAVLDARLARKTPELAPTTRPYVPGDRFDIIFFLVGPDDG